MSKPRALDLFCGAGGATRGLQMAGFHVTGVDLHPQPRYCGDAFFQADALKFPLEGFDFIWASPPCQGYSAASWCHRINGRVYPDFIAPTRARLTSIEAPWVIENVPGAPLNLAIRLCGLSFGLPLLMHRRFESNLFLLAPAHIRHSRGMAIRKEIFTVAGKSRSRTNNRRNSEPYQTASVAEARTAKAIDWPMTYSEMANAVPPAYSEYIGRQVMEVLSAAYPKPIRSACRDAPANIRSSSVRAGFRGLELK